MKTLRTISPLIYPAVLLSLASLAWTTWSLVDLLGTGLIGITVAAGADVVWASVIVAEARSLRIADRTWTVPAVGWAALLAVAGLLVWHGIDSHSTAMAVAGPLLPLGAKVVWLLALTDMRNPAALTDDEQATLARMERGMAFEEATHRIEMRRREMGAEQQLAEVSIDFDIEITRQDKARELTRRRPIELTARPKAQPLAHRAEPAEPTAHPVVEPTAQPPEPTHLLLTSSLLTTPEPTVHPAEPGEQPFGFAAHLTAQSAQRAQAVVRVVELLAQDSGLTSAQVAERLSVSPATAKRYLREARQARP